MARNIDQRLRSLKARRAGTDRMSRVTAADSAEILRKSYIEESYEKRSSQPYTRYALGSMQEVDARYTEISIETAERIQKQLEAALPHRTLGFRLQGSVPCNIHIRGVSDVDLLALDEAFFTYDGHGRRAQAGQYTDPYHLTPVEALGSLRTAIETVLTNKYPGADVDKSGSKAVKISGGSLARPVDVVPSHWHNTADYQQSGAEPDRGVRVLDKKAAETLLNMPFKHIRLVTYRCEFSCTGGLKKAIRLCKHVKADATSDGRSIDFPSFDIAATMYHADVAALRAGTLYELAILAETQRWLDYLACNPSEAQKLYVPDGSRQIFNTTSKIDGLRTLSVEMDDLLREVAKEQGTFLGTLEEPELARSRQVVSERYMPFNVM